MQNLQIQKKLTYSLYVVFSILMYLLLISKMTILVPLISLALAVITLINLKIGLTLWMLIAPLTPIVSGQIESIPMIFNPAFAAGFLGNVLFRRTKMLQDKKSLFFFIYVLGSTVYVSLLYNYFESANAIIDFVLTLVIAYVIIVSYLNYDDMNLNFVISLLLAGFVAFGFALTGGAETRRLSVDGSVRQLSNILGFSSAFIIFILLYYQNNLRYILRVFLLVSLVPLLAGLFLTVSRGVIISVSISCILSCLFYFYFSKNIKKMLSLSLSISIFALLVYISAYDFFVSRFGNYLDVIDQRFQDDALSSGSGIRQYIWQQVLGAFNQIEFLFGTGIGGFRYKSSIAGVFYYSHSVFVDAIASSGVLVFLSMIYMMAFHFIKAFKLHNLLSLGVLIFISLNFATHGSITSPLFWIGLGISIGTNLSLIKYSSIRFYN